MLDEMIVKSKQKKMQRQRERSAQLDQWERLDEQFTNLKKAGELTFGLAAESKADNDDDDYATLVSHRLSITLALIVYLQYQQLESDKRATALEPQRKRDAAKDASNGEEDDDEEQEAQTSDDEVDDEEADEEDEEEEQEDEQLTEQVRRAVVGLSNVIDDILGKRKARLLFN